MLRLFTLEWGQFTRYFFINFLQYKYKIVNYATTMTLATVLGPRYDHPVNRMQLISNTQGDETNQYLLFGCREIMGMQKMPLDGNPWKHVAMLGHPVKVTFLP